MKRFIFFISLLVSIPIAALECSEESFTKGDDEIRKIHALYDITTISVENQEQIKKFEINKDDYPAEIKKLEEQLLLPSKNSSDLFKARLINEENIRRWKSLEKICEKEPYLKAEKARTDAENMKMLIQIRLSSIRELIDLTTIIIASSKQKLESQVKKTD